MNVGGENETSNYEYPLVNLAMENGPFIVKFPMNNWDFP